MYWKLASGVTLIVLTACSRADVAPPAPAVSVSSRITPPPAPACGKYPCRIYADAPAAFAEILGKNPRVLGIGESHALASAAVESATRRFTRDLLPLLRGKATDLVVEVLLPNAKCKAATESARKEQKVVTDQQAPTDQNDFVTLGNEAKALGIQPWALEPTCDDLKKIAAGGADAVAASLDAVTRLTKERITTLLEKRDDKALIVAYGGAMHNDATPVKGRETWAYGADVTALTKTRYAELDLIVPEFVAPTPAWKSLPWFDSYDPAAHPSEVTVMDVNGGAVLVFARTKSAGPAE
jgi:hypothetical protein